MKRWSKHYDACVDCGTTEGRCAGNGRCRSCYCKAKLREYRLKVSPKPTGREKMTLEESLEALQLRAEPLLPASALPPGAPQYWRALRPETIAALLERKGRR